MAFCFTVGMQHFHGQMKGYENITAQCHNCGNWTARCITEWPWFTFCFVPVIPLACGSYKLVACPICNYKQDISARPDVESQHQAGGGVAGGGPPQGQGPYKGQGQGQQGPQLENRQPVKYGGV